MTSCNRYNLEAYDVYHDVDMKGFKAYLGGTGGANVTILYYHKIADGDEDTAVSKETFRAQMQYLHDNDYTVWTLGELFLKVAPTGRLRVCGCALTTAKLFYG